MMKLLFLLFALIFIYASHHTVNNFVLYKSMFVLFIFVKVSSNSLDSVDFLFEVSSTFLLSLSACFLYYHSRLIYTHISLSFFLSRCSCFSSLSLSPSLSALLF